MKIHTALLIALASTSAFAAEVDTNSEAYKTAYKKAYDARIAEKTNKKESAAPVVEAKKSDFFVGAGANYVRYTNDGDATTLVGGEIFAGIDFGKSSHGNWQVQTSVGFLQSGENNRSDTRLVKIDEKITAIPVRASLFYNFAVSESGKSSIYLGPVVGAMFVKDELSGRIVNNSFTSSANATAFTAGAELGCKLNLTGGLSVLAGINASYVSNMSFNHTAPVVGAQTLETGTGMAYVARLALQYTF